MTDHPAPPAGLRLDRQKAPPWAGDELQRLRHELARTQVALERSQAELAQALSAACLDTLTGLPNRRGFDRPSRRLLAAHGTASQPLALLFIDLDGFKAVNDRLGHHAGDELLRIVGARLAHAVRAGDLVCRHGGDEFLCLLPRLCEPERAAAIAAGLLTAIAAPCEIGGQRVSVTASIGLALYPRDGRTVGELLRAADAAMYAAKARGNGQAGADGLCPCAPPAALPSPTV
jgi:diguanylate cyclase (GGDEF)-like protein